MKSDAFEAWLKWRERFKSMTEEEKQEWDEDIEELNRQRYRPYLNDVDKITIKNALNVIYNHCEVSIDANQQVSLRRIENEINQVLKTLEIGEKLE